MVEHEAKAERAMYPDMARPGTTWLRPPGYTHPSATPGYAAARAGHGPKCAMGSKWTLRNSQIDPFEPFG